MSNQHLIAPPRTDGEAQRLALRSPEAAEALGICERLLWGKTKSGEIPHVRIGRAVLYPVDMLQEWLRQQAVGGSTSPESGERPQVEGE